jgi:hypothetical protein
MRKKQITLLFLGGISRGSFLYIELYVWHGSQLLGLDSYVHMDARPSVKTPWPRSF